MVQADKALKLCYIYILYTLYMCYILKICYICVALGMYLRCP